MRHTEENMQINCVRYFGYAFPKLAMYLNHCPLGGYRNKVTGSIMKAMGARAGFPDLFLYVPKGQWHGLAMELKAPKGRQSEYQKEWEQRLTEQGYRYLVIRSFDEFREAVTDYLSDKN